MALKRGSNTRRDTPEMGTSVVVVDDHAGFREQVRVALQRWGFDVVGEASDCHSALAEVAARRPDVVLLDIQLPDGLAFGVAQTLRAKPDRPAVVLISGRDASDYGPRVSECGAVGFIAKVDLSARSLAAVLGDETQ